MGHQLNPEWQDMSNSIDILILMYIKNKYADNMFLYGMVTKYDALSYSCEFILIHKNKFSLILYESFYVLKILIASDLQQNVTTYNNSYISTCI